MRPRLPDSDPCRSGERLRGVEDDSILACCCELKINAKSRERKDERTSLGYWARLFPGEAGILLPTNITR